MKIYLWDTGKERVKHDVNTKTYTEEDREFDNAMLELCYQKEQTRQQVIRFIKSNTYNNPGE